MATTSSLSLLNGLFSPANAGKGEREPGGATEDSQSTREIIMKTGQKRSAARKPCFRPALEILESRDLLSAGSLDLTFGAGGRVTTDFGKVAYANAVAMQPDDKIVVAGS